MNPVLHLRSLVRPVVLLTLVLGTGCASSLPPLPDWQPVPVPPADQVESVIIFFGDPGRSEYQRAPVIQEAAREVEKWSATLARDSAVSVVYLGDLVYPEGLHPPGHANYPRDSLFVQAEIDVVDGPYARAHNTQAYFIAGNHDWGEARGVEGVDRLKNLEEFLERARERWDVNVDLLPPAGEPGPAVVDVGAGIRMILLDTAWWLLSTETERKSELIARIEAAMESAHEEGREVILTAHHPWQTAGSHGGSVDFWRAFGLRWFLFKTGSLLQDINSRPMKDLRLALDGVFQRVGPPLLFAGGHDHSLQVIEGPGPLDPHWTLVSGTGVKVTQVGHLEGMRFRATKAGYMTLVTLHNGESILYVRGADEEWIACPNEHHAEVDPCMDAAPAAFDMLFSIRLSRDG